MPFLKCLGQIILLSSGRDWETLNSELLCFLSPQDKEELLLILLICLCSESPYPSKYIFMGQMRSSATSVQSVCSLISRGT